MTELEAAYYGAEIRYHDHRANQVRWYVLPGRQGWCVTVRYADGRYVDLHTIAACQAHRQQLAEGRPYMPDAADDQGG